MYERMLDKQSKPTIQDMMEYCGEQGELLRQLHEWLSKTYDTTYEVVFPYGNKYGWGIAHRKKKTLLCNIFPEHHAFSVMMRLSDQQFSSIYDTLQAYTKDYIDHRYPCSDGGWIHYRVTCKEHFEDVKKLLVLKCS